MLTNTGRASYDRRDPRSWRREMASCTSHSRQRLFPLLIYPRWQIADFRRGYFQTYRSFVGKKLKLFWNFKINLFHLCISLRLWILNPKLPEAQMFPHAGSQQARQQSAPPSRLRLWAAILEFLGSEVSCWQKNPHIWDSSDLNPWPRWLPPGASQQGGSLSPLALLGTGAPPADPQIIDQRWSVAADQSQSARKP